jgi:hypothetical protein
MPRPKAIPEWKRSWRWLSMQIGASAALFGMLPVEQQTAVLDLIGMRPDQLPLALGLAFMAGRLLQQENK